MTSAASKPFAPQAFFTVDPSAPTDALGDKILDAAFEQFRLLGIRRSSMEDVARRAGVGRVTIYRRFESKDRLVQILLLRECQRAIAEIDMLTAGVADVEERIVETFLAAMRIVRPHPLILGLLQTEPDMVLPLLTVRANMGLALGRAYVTQQIERARKDLGLPGTDAEQVAEMFARLVISLVLTPKTTLPLDDDASAREFARRHIVPMITRSV
jgi:AcrR family transcriptional regulator